MRWCGLPCSYKTIRIQSSTCYPSHLITLQRPTSKQLGRIESNTTTYDFLNIKVTHAFRRTNHISTTTPSLNINSLLLQFTSLISKHCNHARWIQSKPCQVEWTGINWNHKSELKTQGAIFWLFFALIIFTRNICEMLFCRLSAPLQVHESCGALRLCLCYSLKQTLLTHITNADQPWRLIFLNRQLLELEIGEKNLKAMLSEKDTPHTATHSFLCQGDLIQSSKLNVSLIHYHVDVVISKTKWEDVCSDRNQPPRKAWI